MIKKEKMGICPKCGSENVDYKDYNYIDDFMVYEVICNNCRCKFREYTKVQYVGYGMDDDEYNELGEKK